MHINLPCTFFLGNNFFHHFWENFFLINNFIAYANFPNRNDCQNTLEECLWLLLFIVTDKKEGYIETDWIRWEIQGNSVWSWPKLGLNKAEAREGLAGCLYGPLPGSVCSWGICHKGKEKTVHGSFFPQAASASVPFLPVSCSVGEKWCWSRVS